MDSELSQKIVFTSIFVAFLGMVVLPVVYTFGKVFFWEDDLSKNVQLLDMDVLYLLLKSSFISLIISLLSTFLGSIIAFVLYKTDFRFKAFFKVVLLIPLFVSPYILAVAWKDMFFFLGVESVGSTSVGMIGVLTMVFVPLSMLIVGSGLANIDAQIEESGLMLTGFWSVMRKIVLPLIKPALMSSFVLVFIFSISEFSVPAYFGVQVFTTEIFTQFSAFYNHSLAILQSSLLVLICVGLLFLEGSYLGDAPFLSVGAKGQRRKTYSFRFGLGVVGSWFLVSVILPLGVLFAQAFSDGPASFFRALDLLRHSFLGSITLSFGGAFLITLVGLVAALGHFRKGRAGSRYFGGFLLLIFAIPSTIYGISLIKFYNQPILDVIYSSYVIILIGYVGKFAFIAAKIIGNGLRQIPDSLDESAELMGVGYWNRLRKITLPLIGPSLFTAFLIGFIFSLGELGATIMLYPPGTEIMPIKVFTLMANAPESLTSAMVLVVFLVSLVMVLVFFGVARLYKPEGAQIGMDI